jgi:cobalt/nickel transport protein
VSESRRVSTRMLMVVGLLLALTLAGVASFYASNRPDGLNRVAQDEGFSNAQRGHGSAEGPLAGYETQGVDDARLSGGMAGVVGSIVVLAIAGGTVLLLRRRRPAEAS